MWWYMFNNSSSQSGNGYKEIQVPGQPRLQLSESNREQEKFSADRVFVSPWNPRTNTQRLSLICVCAEWV